MEAAEERFRHMVRASNTRRLGLGWVFRVSGDLFRHFFGHFFWTPFLTLFRQFFDPFQQFSKFLDINVNQNHLAHFAMKSYFLISIILFQKNYTSKRRRRVSVSRLLVCRKLLVESNVIALLF